MRHIPFHPVLIGAAFVLGNYAEVMLDPITLARPLAVTLLVTLVAVAIASVLFRSVERGALLTTFVLGAVVSKPAVTATLALADRQALAAIVLVAAIILLVVVCIRMAARRHTSAQSLGGALNVFAVLLLGVALVRSVSGGFLDLLVLPARQPPQGSVEVAAYPDIYVLLLDAYPGVETLDRVFGFDNTPFTSALDDLGFEVVDDARANYWFTSLTLASMFNMAPVQEVSRLQPIVAGLEPARPGWRQGINEAAAFDVLRAHGYRIESAPSGWTDVSLRAVPDEVLDGGQINDFETHLLRTTYLSDLAALADPEFFVQQKADRIKAVFDAFGNSAEHASNVPHFVFAHVPAPHPPLALAADGTTVEWSDMDSFFGITTSQMGLSAELYEQRFVDQLQYVNRRALEVAEEVITADEDAIIILMSDHGPGNPADPLDSASIDLHARLDNLLAVRDPGHSSLLPDDASPVNILPRIFNAHLRTELPIHPNTSYRSTIFGTDEMYTELEAIPESDLSGG